MRLALLGALASSLPNEPDCAGEQCAAGPSLLQLRGKHQHLAVDGSVKQPWAVHQQALDGSLKQPWTKHQYVGDAAVAPDSDASIGDAVDRLHALAGADHLCDGDCARDHNRERLERLADLHR
jgi:hypothetical protein